MELSVSLVFYILVFIFGTIFGSFGNVVIYRIRSSRSLGGRSRCLSCGKTLAAWMLVPVFSYVFQRGKCAHCGSHISIQYPLVEFTAGLLSVLTFHLSGFDPLNPTVFLGTLFACDLFFFLTLLLITVYDLRHKIIPDELAIILALLGLMRAFLALSVIPESSLGGIIPAFDYFSVVSRYWSPWWNLCAGILIPLPFASAWFFSGGRWVGLGDAKIAVGLGFAFGLAYGLTSVVLGFWVGAIVSAALLLKTQLSSREGGVTMRSELPFAPFLALGALIIYMTGINIANWTF